jgi:hypothetical protein
MPGMDGLIFLVFMVIGDYCGESRYTFLSLFSHLNAAVKRVILFAR